MARKRDGSIPKHDHDGACLAETSSEHVIDLPPPLNDDSLQRRAAALQGVVSDLNREYSLADLLPPLARHVADAAAADRVGIFIYNDAADGMVLHHRRGFDQDEDHLVSEMDSTPPVMIDGERRMLELRRSLANEELAGSAPTFPGAAVALVPIMSGSVIRGALWVLRVDGNRRFSPDDLAMLEAIAGQGAVAVTRARLVEEERRQRRRATALSQVAIALNEAPSLDALMLAIAEASAGAIGVDRAEVHAFDESQVATIASGYYGFTYSSQHADTVNKEPPVAIPAETEVIRTRQPLLRHRGTPFRSPYPVDGWISDIVIPLVTADTTQGVLYVWADHREHHFADDEVDLLLAIGNMAGLAILRARDAELARRRADHLALLNQVGRAVGATLDVDTACAALHAQVGRVLSADAFFVALLESETGEIWFPYLFDSGELYLGESKPPQDGPTSTVARTRQSYIKRPTADPVSDAGTAFGDQSRRSASALYVPMLHGDDLIGVLSVQSYLAKGYTDDDLRTLETIGGQAAAALAHARLYADAQTRSKTAERQRDQLQAVLASTRAITGQVELSQTLAALADDLQRLLPHDVLAICRTDRENWRFAPLLARIHGNDWAGPWDFSLDQGILGRVAGSGIAEIVNDAHLDLQSFYQEGYPVPEGAEHLLVAPLRVRGEVTATIILARSSDQRFSDDDFELFQVLAGQASVALQASLILDEEQRRRRHATTLVEVAAALNRAATIEQLSEQIATAAARAVGVDRSSLYLYDEEASRTISSCQFGFPRTASNDMPPRDIDVERELIAIGRLLTGERLSELVRLQPEVHGTAYRRGAALPILLHGRVRGTLYVWSATGEPNQAFDEEETALLEAIGDQAAVAIERTLLTGVSARRVGELRLLGEVNAAIARSLNLNAIVAGTFASLAEIIAFKTGVVTTWDANTATLSIAAAWGADTAGLVGMALPIDASVNGMVFRLGTPFFGTNDHGPIFYRPEGTPDVGAHIMAIPLRLEKEIIGTFFVARHEPGPFAAEDQQLATLVAGQLAVGVERARIHAVALTARERSERQAEGLAQVLTTSQTLALQPDLASTLEAVGAGVERLVSYSACAVLRFDEQSQELVLAYNRSLDGFTFPYERLPLGTGFTGIAAQERRALRVNHAEADPRLPPGLRVTDETGESPGPFHVISVPLIVEGGLIGSLTIMRSAHPPFNDDEFATVQVFAVQAAAALQNAELLARNRDLYLGGVRALASAVDAKDPYTRGHSERVAKLGEEIAIAMGLDRRSAETIGLAGLLHDIGKIGVPDAILQKPSVLSDTERAVMMGHAALGASIISDAKSTALQALVPLVRHHHEWVDGRGYPDGLAGEEIPHGAAILAVADAFDTIVTDRPYRAGRPAMDELAELRRGAGRQFRDDVVEALAGLDRVQAAMIEPEMGAAAPGQQRAVTSGPLAAGQMGDTRALGLLVELTTITHHIPDRPRFLAQVAALVRRYLQLADIFLLLVDPDRGDLELVAHSGVQGDIAIGYRQPLGIGINGHVATTGRTMNVPDVTREPLFVQNAGLAYSTGSELVVPLLADDGVIGLINVKDRRTAAFTAADETVLAAVAGQVAAAIYVSSLHEAATFAATTDGLTGLSNHRAFYDALGAAIAARPEVLSVILFDVERLKQINDSSGHLAGDAVLRHVAQVMRTQVRADDVVARYGGDEFAVMMSGADYAAATRIAKRVRRVLRTEPVSGAAPSATVRFGVATLPDDGLRPPDLVAVADARLYAMHAAPTPLRAARRTGD